MLASMKIDRVLEVIDAIEDTPSTAEEIAKRLNTDKAFRNVQGRWVPHTWHSVSRRLHMIASRTGFVEKRRDDKWIITDKGHQYIGSMIILAEENCKSTKEREELITHDLVEIRKKASISPDIRVGEMTQTFS